MSDTLRYIVAGVGTQGAIWCRSILPRLATLGKAECVAAVDPSADRLEFARDYLGLRREDCFANLVEAIDARRADFLVNLTPTVHHERINDVALTYDLHVLCESPVADTMESAVRTYRKMKSAKRKMMVASAHRFEQDKQTLAEHMRSVEVGRLNYLTARFTANLGKSPAWGRGRHEMLNPLLVEAGTQHFDLLRALTGSEFKTVYAHSWNPVWADFKGDSCATVVMQMTNGVHGAYEGAVANASTLNGMHQEYVRAECERATLELDRGSIRMITGGGLGEPSVEPMPMMEQEAWGAAVLAEQFCDWVAAGKHAPPPPACSLHDHMQVAAAVFAAVESAHTGKAIDVPDFLQEHLRRIPKGTVTITKGAPPAAALPAEPRTTGSSALDLLLDDPLEDILGR